MATDLSPVYDALRQADAAGDTAGAQKLAAYIKSSSQTHVPQSLQQDTSGNLVPTGSPAAQAANSPVSDSSFQNYRAGWGKSVMDLARGVGQLTGLESRQDVANSRALDAPLMKTTAGKAGDLSGSIANLLPTAMIPGANTLAGSAAIGAGTGLLSPSTSTQETLGNTALGGALGPVGIGIGRGAGALYQGAKAALEPLFQGGQQRVAARALQAFAGGPQDAAAAAQRLANPPSVLPGVQPTTAELANNAGLSQMERSLRNNPEYLTAMTNRNQANRGAMTTALGNIAGTPQDMALATRMRSQLSSPLYDSATSAVVSADPDLGKLMARPSMQKAWDRAQQIAAERSIQLTPANTNDVSGQTLQYLKMGLNDLQETADQKGMGAHEQAALANTLGDFNKWTMKNVPQLRAADRSYQDLSRPINQMQVGSALSDKLIPALGDFGNNTRLSAGNYANALRNGDQLAAKVTGQPQLGLRDILNPGQQRTVQQVGEQLGRRANADELGRAVGSNTGQNVISQNTLAQFLGPLGLPQGLAARAAQSSLGQSIVRPLNFLTQAGTPKVMDQLANAALDPQTARGLLQMAAKNPRIAQMLWARQGLLGPIANTAGQGLLGNAQQ